MTIKENLSLIALNKSSFKKKKKTLYKNDSNLIFHSRALKQSAFLHSSSFPLQNI